MEHYICKTCGAQYAASEKPPAACDIRNDERQYVGWDGQQWTTLARLRASGAKNDVRDEEPGLTGIGATPSFGIGQRALLVQTPRGNVLWDCISLLDDATVREVGERGGIAGIVMSHPHFYGSMIEWSHAFGNAPVYIPWADKQWVTRPDPAVKLWENKVEIVPGVTAVQTGGHFEGSAALHWAAGDGGRGALLVGDTITVVQDRSYVSFMRSYPNLIPLPASAITHIVEAVRPYKFNRVYGGWWNRNVSHDAMKAIERSAQRYVRQIKG